MISITHYKGCRIVKISHALFYTIHIPSALRVRAKTEVKDVERRKTYESAKRLIDSL